MTDDTGWRIIQSAFRCSAELQELLRFLKEHDAEAYEAYRFPVASTIDAINVQVTAEVLAARPELEARIESELARIGRIT